MAPPQIVAPAKFSVHGGFCNARDSEPAHLHSLPCGIRPQEVTLRGWVYRLRVLSKTTEVRALNRSGGNLPFNAASEIESVGLETLLEHRPLALRNPLVGVRIQAALLRFFREISDEPTLHGDRHLEDRGIRNRGWNQSLRAEVL
jgi:hypothetical protein